MFRRYGEHLILSLTFSVFVLECLALVYLTWRFVQRFSGWIGFEGLMRSLIAVTVLTAIFISLFMLVIITLHALIRIREAVLQRQIGFWIQQLSRNLLTSRRCPPNLPFAGQLALLSLRESLAGEESELALNWIREQGLSRSLIRRIRSNSSQTVKLNALEHVAKARLSEAIPELLGLLQDRSANIRIHAAWALGRCIADLDSKSNWPVPASEVSKILGEADLPAGILEECLVLMQSNAEDVIAGLLGPHSSILVLRSSINAAGLLSLIDLMAHIGKLMIHPEPEVQSASIRFCNRVGVLPRGAEKVLEQYLKSPLEYLRIQSVRALAMVDPQKASGLLQESIADSSWWVRRAAAECLEQLGPVGYKTLQYCAHFHPDSFARQTCLQLLLDRGWMKADDPRHFWETA